jgi:outer membrane protein assembly factor BamB
VKGTVIYSHPGFGLIRAYRADSHTQVWENPHIELNRIYGLIDGVLIGGFIENSLERRPTILYGIDIETGAELWKRESLEPFGGLNIVSNILIDDDDNLLVTIDPNTGNDLVSLDIEGNPISFIENNDGFIIIISKISDNKGSVVRIRP